MFQFSEAQVYVFLLAANLGKEFQSSSNFCPPYCLSQLNFVGAVKHFSFHCFALNFTVLHSISLFCTGEMALFTDLGLIDMHSQNAEIVACILLQQISLSYYHA